MKTREEIRSAFFKALEISINRREACKLIGFNEKSIHYYVKSDEIPIEKKSIRNKIDHHYFDVIDSEDKAYLLGMFIADGALYKSNRGNNYRFSISLQEGDENIIEMFKNRIALTHDIFIKDDQRGVAFRKKQHSIRWSSPYMADLFINKYKITTQKTKDVEFQFPLEVIPERLIRHFVRGFFDGDGCFSIYGKYNIIDFSLVFTSLPFCNQIAKILESAIPSLKRKIYECQNKNMITYSLRFNHLNRKKFESMVLLYDYFYKDSEFFMERKKLKIESYLKEYRDKYPNNER